MFGLFIRSVLSLLVLNHLFTPCIAWRTNKGYSSGGKIENSGYRDQGKVKTFAGTSAGIPGQNATRRGLGISAWGIIMLVITMILAGMGFYYFSMCYPILCKKERNYDIIEMAHV